MKTKLFTFLCMLTLVMCKTPEAEQRKIINDIPNPTNKVVLSSEIVWEKLNPARGVSSPQAGTVWGDRKANVATGFLAKFVDGFSSPPHVHNVTYRAVVIKGQVHNADENDVKMWMNPGSFWTQPVGQAHITSAKGIENIAYVEIDEGPYLVKPTKQATTSNEKPVNIDARNIVWLDDSKSNWIANKNNAAISFLWESGNNLKGVFVKLPKKFNGKIESEGSVFHAIIVSGNLNYILPENKAIKTLDAGSYFTSEGKSIHDVETKNNEDVIIYIRTNGNLLVK